MGPHSVPAVTHELGITLTQRHVCEKTNEVPISTEILTAFDVGGKVVTTDALLTHRSFCAKVIESGGEYVLPVKRNQKELFNAIETLFKSSSEVCGNESADAVVEKNHRIWGESLDTFETVEKSHGRLEIRRLKASSALNDYLDWPGVSQVFECRYTFEYIRSGKVSEAIQYGITSLSASDASAAYLLRLRRGHWSIENKSHWVRDVVYDEDKAQVRCGVIPQVMAALRNGAISVIRFAGYPSVAAAMRYFATKPKQALNLIRAKYEN